MTIWGTIYSYLFGNEIQHIYKEAETAYPELKQPQVTETVSHEPEKPQEGWVYVNEKPLTDIMLHKPEAISSSEIQLVTDLLGEGADKKLMNPIYESFLNHVNQEIATLDKMIAVMSHKYKELTPQEALRSNMHSVLSKLEAKKADLVSFKGRIILLANVNGEVKERIEQNLVSVELLQSQQPRFLPLPPPMPIPGPGHHRKTPPITILKNRVEQGIKLGPNPHATMIELLQKGGVKLRKLTEDDRRQQLPDSVQKELINAIRFKQYKLRSVKEQAALVPKMDLQKQLLLELKEKKLTVTSLRKVEDPRPMRKGSKPESLQEQMEDILRARRHQIQDTSESDNEIENGSEWGSYLMRPISETDETDDSLCDRDEESIDILSSEDTSSSSLLYRSSDIDEYMFYNHHTSPVLDLDHEPDSETGIFTMSEDEAASEAELEGIMLSRGFIASPIPSLSQGDLSSGIIMSSSYTDTPTKPYSI